MKPKKIISYLVKLTVSCIAVYYIVNQVGWKELTDSIGIINPFYFILALTLYFISQLLSTERLRIALRQINIPIPFNLNFKLYMIGMSYNLFLPGGIGGDAYKAIFLSNQYGVAKKPVIAALLIDRLYGLLAILVLLNILVTNSSYSLFAQAWILLFIPIILLVAYFLTRALFPSFIMVFQRLLTWSIFVQSVQIGCILVLGYAFGINDVFNLGTLFLISSVATVIPVFLGGIGAREIVFTSLAGYLSFTGIEASLLAIALSFSIITLISSLPGLIIDWMIPLKSSN